MQKWNAEQYARTVRFVSDLGDGVLQLLAPQPGERVLDLGCGDGPLSAKLVSIGCSVKAVDASEEMIAAACALGLDAQVMDGQKLCFDNEFDAVFSNAALHWMPRADDVVAGVRRALKSRGRFVAEFGGGHNVKTIVDALSEQLDNRGLDAATYNPWYFPSTEAYSKVLEQGRFVIDSMELFERPTPLPGDIAGWLQTFAQSFTAGVAPEERDEFLEDVRRTLQPELCDESGAWSADYVRLRFAAHRRD